MRIALVLAAAAAAAALVGCGAPQPYKVTDVSVAGVKLYYGLNVLEKPMPVGYLLPPACRYVEGEKYPFGAIHCVPPSADYVGGAPLFAPAPYFGGFGGMPFPMHRGTTIFMYGR